MALFQLYVQVNDHFTEVQYITQYPQLPSVALGRQLEALITTKTLLILQSQNDEVDRGTGYDKHVYRRSSNLLFQGGSGWMHST